MKRRNRRGWFSGGSFVAALAPWFIHCEADRKFNEGGATGGQVAGTAGAGTSGTAGRGSAGRGGAGTGGAGTSGRGGGGSTASGGTLAGTAGNGGSVSGQGTGGDGTSGSAGESGGASGAGAEGGSAGEEAGAAGSGEAPPDPCETEPCQNDGTCTTSGSSFTCACADGYFGTLCDTLRFEWLGVDGSSVSGMSADGTVVVGSVPGVSRNVPARWTKASGFIALESLSEPIDQGYAVAADADGSVIVGQANLPSGGGAFRWTESDGVVAFGLGPVSIANGISSNGNTIVGTMYGSETQPLTHVFRWTATTGAQDVLNLGSGGFVTGTNADGTAIVGSYTSDGGVLAPFRWTQTPGLIRLGTDLSGQAEEISLDGTTIAGNASDGLTLRPFLYTNSAGFSYLPLEGVTNTQMTDMSGNGELLSGWSTEGVWLWDEVNGTRMFTDVFEELGADLSEWTSLSVYAISADATVLAGDGYKENRYTSWIARL